MLYLMDDACKAVFHSLDTLRLDSATILLNGLASTIISHHHQVQHTTVRYIIKILRRQHLTSMLKHA